MDFDEALNILASGARRLRKELRFDWSEQTHETVCALRFRRSAGGAAELSVTAVVGGASSGKSTVFNNLLGGRRVSLVTIKSHATRGLILAGHESLRPQLERWLEHERLLLPSLAPVTGDGQDIQGCPGVVNVVYHTLPALKTTLLVDSPDFTSNAAEREGDLTLSHLPWFDRLLIVVDHERWFDRQVVDDLRQAADRLAQPRMVVFNRTAEEDLAATDRAHLIEQARQLGAGRVCILNYQRGRGFRRFDSATFGEAAAFLAEPIPDRRPALRAAITHQTGLVQAANRRRVERLERLGRVLAAAAKRQVPASTWEWVTAMMTPEERDRLDVLSRVFGVAQVRDWLGRQRQRLERTLASVPLLGLRTTASPAVPGTQQAAFSREQSGLDYFDAQCERQRRRFNEDAAGSAFWEEVRTRVGGMPVPLTDEFTAAHRPGAETAVTKLSRALETWEEKVRTECQGLSPQVAGSLGMTVIGIAAVLVAVPGPVAALTPMVVAGAIKAGLVKIGAAGLFGAFSGRPVARLVEIIRERLLVSPEYGAVQAAAEACRRCVDEHCQAAMNELMGSARRYTLMDDPALAAALEAVTSSST